MTARTASQPKPLDWKQFGEVSTFLPTKDQEASIALYEQASDVYSTYEIARNAFVRDPQETNKHAVVNALVALKEKGLILNKCPQEIDDAVTRIYENRQGRRPQVEASERAPSPLPAQASANAEAPPKNTFPNIRLVYGDVYRLPEPNSYKLSWVREYLAAREACKNHDTLATRKLLDAKAFLVLRAELLIDPCPSDLMDKHYEIHYRDSGWD